MSPEHAALEQIEIAAFADLYRAAPEPIRTSLRIDAHEVASATCLRCSELNPTAIFRRACGLDQKTAVSDADLDTVMRHMREPRQPFAVPAAPDTKQSTLAKQLSSRGFTPGYAFMKFSRLTAGVTDVDCDLDIALIGRDRAEAFGRVISAGFGLPETVAPWLAQLPGREGWVCLLATADGVPAAAAAAYVKGIYAWLGLGATLPPFQRRGAQSALIVRRLKEAGARGAQIAATETGERVPDRPSISYRNILRCGFQERYLRDNYMSPPA